MIIISIIPIIPEIFFGFIYHLRFYNIQLFRIYVSSIFRLITSIISLIIKKSQKSTRGEKEKILELRL